MKSTQLIGRAALSTLMIASVWACGSGEVSVEDDVALSIAAPLDGAVVRRPDDVDPLAAGIQVDVVVRVDGALDGTVVLLGTTLDPVDAEQALVADGEAVFTGFTLSRGVITLYAATQTCNAATCVATIELSVVESDTQVAIARPTEGEVVGVGDVPFTIVRVSGAAPQSCRVYVDGMPVGNFVWENQAQPLVVASTLAAGEHTARAACLEWLDTISTQEVTFVVDGTAPGAPSLRSEPVAPGHLDFDNAGAYINLDTTDVSAEAGLQHDVTVTVDGHGESTRDWIVRLFVTPPAAPETTYEQVLVDSSEPIDVRFDAVHFGDTDGDIAFRVVVLDSVGRSSPEDTASLIIDRTPPLLELAAPDPLQRILSRAHDLEPATFDSVEVDFTVTPTDAVGEVLFQLDAHSPVAQAVASPVVFPRLSLLAGDYVVTFSVVDVAGNRATLSHPFSVATFVNSVTIVAPVGDVFNAAADEDNGAALLQAQFTVTATGFEDGSTVVLCSTIDNGDGIACDGGGFVVGSGFLTGDLAASSAAFTATFADGAQTVRAEAFELDDSPRESSATRDILVDTLPPSFVNVDFPLNDAGNDAASIVRLGTVELDGGGNVVVVVGVAGLEPILPVSVFVDGVATAASTGPYGFALALPDGVSTLAFAMADAAGNPAVSSDILVEVDRTAGAVVVDPPFESPYTSSSADIGVVVTDASGGGSLVLERYTSPLGGVAVSQANATLAAGETRFDFVGFPLGQGLSYLQATYTDAFGNSVVSDRVLYAADFIGPTLTLGVRTAAGASQSCDTLGASCLADTRDLAGGTIGLDRSASDPVCGFGPCSTLGTDLFFSLAQCVNSDASLESCPLTVRLQSRLPGDPDFVDVLGGSFSTGEVAAASVASDPRLEPGTVRELRLVTADSNGNASVSNTVFITINFSGTVFAVERLDGGLNTTGDMVADDRYFGIAENVLDSASGRFQANFRAYLTAYGVTPTTVRLTVDNSGGTTSYEVPVLGGGGLADFAGVELLVATDPASPATNAMTVQAMCGPDPCGAKSYSGVVADVVAPTYEFDRCALCANGVPMVSIACPAACGDATAASNIAGPGNPAIWNLALDADHDGANGFDAQPVVLNLSGIEDGRTLRLETDLGTLGGNVLASDGCAGAFACSKSFPLTASHLAGTAVRRISVAFSDRAGNLAVPRAVRIDSAHESIYARTDVIAPSGVAASPCIGESTPPVSGFDVATLEAPACAAACAATGTCSRTGASAALTWLAPGDDAGNGNVVAYVIGVAALGIPYGATTYASCTDLTPSGPFETTATLPGAAQPGGAIETVAVPDLYPHRDYCFLVVATDDVGNSSPAGSFVSRRKIPLVTAPNIQSFDGLIRNDAQAAGAFRSEPASPPDFGAFATSLPDLDGDGRDDFAVTQFTSGSVQVYLSGTAGFDPAITINAPAIAYSGSFGAAVAGGDFDGDGLNDLAICDPTLLTVGFPEAGPAGGALFLYYGVLGSGIARNVNTTTPQVPSLHPDVSLLGASGRKLCANIVFGNVIGDANLDVVATTSAAHADPRAFIIAGGDRGRLAPGASFFDLTADVVIAPEPFAVGWPRRLAVGDYDGDGVDELAISDDDEVLTYDAGLFTTAVTFEPSATGFGEQLVTVRSPRVTPGDWLLVGTTDDRVVVLASGFMASSYPLASYVTLDATTWDGAPASRFGRSLASIGDFDGRGGVDIVVGPGTVSSGGPYDTFLYSFDPSVDGFEKRAILRGPAGFSSTLVGVRAYTSDAALQRSQLLVIQRIAARLFMFR